MLGTANNSPLCYFEENLTLPELSGKTGFVQSTLTSMFSSSLTIFLGHGPRIGGFFNHFYIFLLQMEGESAYYVKIDCKTVGFFLKISKEIGKAWRKSLACASV